MTSRKPTKTRNESQPCWSGPDEPQSHIEHRAALDATVFRSGRDPYELVLELDAGELRLHRERAGG